MLPMKKRNLKQKVDKALADFIKENCSTDEEFFLTLLYFNESIATDLSRFDDVYENENEV